jgi:sulfoxide reductase heme-binding subunit YedZ
MAVDSGGAGVGRPASGDRPRRADPPAAGNRARPKRRRVEPLPWLKPGVFLGALVPLISIALRGSRGELGANPIARVENELGLAALVFLLAALACTPAKRLWGWTWQMRIRRELGLFAFTYASLHFLTYLVLDQFFDWNAIVADIVKRPFITVGFSALVLMIPLALTSTRGAVRRLGFRRWKLLHRLVYLAGILAVTHFIWRVKLDISQPILYAALLAALLAFRVVVWLRRRSDSGERPN